jgi:hypothetical protein
MNAQAAGQFTLPAATNRSAAKTRLVTRLAIQAVRVARRLSAARIVDQTLGEGPLRGG